MWNSNFMPSKFFCTRCGKEGICLPRKKGSRREGGHLKKIYCVHCKDDVNHAEVSDEGRYTYQMFLEEFNNGVFNTEGKRR